MFLYKPEMAKTCCPAYTIRLKAESFSPSKEQNRVMHRLQRFVLGGACMCVLLQTCLSACVFVVICTILDEEKVEI